MKLAHHTSKHTLEYIKSSEVLAPAYDHVWMTTKMSGDVTAGMTMPEEHRARIIIDSKDIDILKVDDNRDMFPHLDFYLLNMITNTNDWYISMNPIPVEKFDSISTMKNGEWINEKV